MTNRTKITEMCHCEKCLKEKVELEMSQEKRNIRRLEQPKIVGASVARTMQQILEVSAKKI